MNDGPGADWALAEARRLSPLLESRHAAVISSADPIEAAQVALELARIHGTSRRVAIADLIGDAAPLLHAARTGDDDPHGISDSFLYGVSLNRIARPIDPAGNVFLMPSGTEAVALPEVYGNDRWRRLAAGFGQVGALLLVVARRDVDGFGALCGYIGALLPLDAQRPAPLPGVELLWRESDASRAALLALARGGTPPRGASARSAERDAATTQRESGAASGATGGTAFGADADASFDGSGDVPTEPLRGGPRARRGDATVNGAQRKAERAREVATEDRAHRQSRTLATVAAAAAMVLLGLAVWPEVQTRVFPDGAPATAADSTVLTAVSGGDADAGADADAGPAGAAGDADPGGEAAGTLAADRPATAATAGPLVIANLADSARAAQFAVYFVAANTVEEARPPAGLATMAGVAVSPVLLGNEGSRWYRVTVGAGTDSAQADALLTRLRNANQIGSANGSIIRVPFAFRLEEGVEAAQANDALSRWSTRGIRAYGLRQTDGSVTVYTGAFQNVGQARLLADSLFGVGIPPTLVYRTGRTF